MTARLALVLAVLAGCTITPADAAPTQTAPVSGLPAAAVATMPAVPVVPRTTLPAPTTLPAYQHPDPNVERWHALALSVGWPEAEWGPPGRQVGDGGVGARRLRPRGQAHRPRRRRQGVPGRVEVAPHPRHQRRTMPRVSRGPR